MKIIHDKNKNRLVISEIGNSDMMSKIIEYSYCRHRRIWTIPLTRLNCRVIKEQWLEDENISKDIMLSSLLSYVDFMYGYNDIKRVPFPNYAFKTIPREYQKKALDYIYNVNTSALHMEMGTGKSKMAIDKMVSQYMLEEIDSMIVICQCSIRNVWLEQLEQHCKVGYTAIVCNPKTKEDLKKLADFHDSSDTSFKILVVGTESLQQERNKAVSYVRKYVDKFKCGVVLDEAHDIKNSRSNRAHIIKEIAKKTKHRLYLTGTPIANSIIDLYSLFDFLDPNIIGVSNLYAFKNRYVITQDRVINSRCFSEIIGYKNTEELIASIKPYTVDIMKKDVLDIPDKVYTQRYVEMTPDQAKAYATMKKERMAIIPKLDDTQATVIIPHVLAMYTALQQIAGGYLSIEDEGTCERKLIELVPPSKNKKVACIKEIISEIPDTEQVIIWAKYRHEVFMLEKELNNYMSDKFKKACAVYLDTDDMKKQKINSEMNDKEVRYFISTRKSGGVGITMNTVAYVINYSHDFSYINRVQAEDRNHRIGQTRSVTYFDIIVENTIEQTDILPAIQTKKDLANLIKERIKNNEYC